MVRRGLQPDNFTFSSLINACAKAQQAERAFAVKARMAAQALVSVTDSIPANSAAPADGAPPAKRQRADDPIVAAV